LKAVCRGRWNDILLEWVMIMRLSAPFSCLLLCLISCLTAEAAITVNGLQDKTRYYDAVTFTIMAPSGFQTTAALDGQPVDVGVPVTVSQVQYHELVVEQQPTAGGTTDTLKIRFIVRNSQRISTEDGIPTFTPPPFVADAPSAFAQAILTLVAPADYPKGLAVPVVGFLRDAAGEPLWLNGTVQSSQFPSAPLELRRGWGSVLLTGVTNANEYSYDGRIASLADAAPIRIEGATTWTSKSGTIGSEDWGPNARIHVTSNLTIRSGATLNVKAGSVILLGPGVEIIADGGVLNIAGTLAQPVVFTPQSAAQPWGGIQLKTTTGSRLTATGAIFTGSGADPTWFNTHSGYSVHRREEACLLVDKGAQADLTNCFLLRLAGQAFHLKSGTLTLTDCLVQGATTGGELVGGTFTALRSGFLEFPDATTNFVDGDNDGFYLVPGSGNLYTLERCMVATTKDDGLDSNGGQIIVRHCWIENCVHEGFSPSVTGHNSQSIDTVFFHCGQGLEQGYGGPVVSAEHCLMLGCLVGIRSGDNYGSPTFTDYSGHMTVRNCLSLYNTFHDVWGYEWNSWTYRTDRMTIEDNHLTQTSALHPKNALWDPVLDGEMLAAFMPVPDSNVGVAITGLSSRLSLADYPDAFDVRLSTFSSRPVSVRYSLIGSVGPAGAAAPDLLLGAGAVRFDPGETWKVLDLPLPADRTWRTVRLVLTEPNNAEVTGETIEFVATAPAPPDAVLIPKGTANWMVQALRAEPSGNWRALDYAETNWVQNKTAPIGFGDIGVAGAYVPLKTVLTSTEQGPSSDRTRTVYFRHHFRVEDPLAIRSLSLSLMVDDGAVVYLNGSQVGRFNIDTGTTEGGFVSYSTLASRTLDGAEEAAFVSMPVDADLLKELVPGDNVIAVEVHQSSATSSDLVLDLELVASFYPPEENDQ
jgi:hypothetical protein